MDFPPYYPSGLGAGVAGLSQGLQTGLGLGMSMNELTARNAYQQQMLSLRKQQEEDAAYTNAATIFTKLPDMEPPLARAVGKMTVAKMQARGLPVDQTLIDYLANLSPEYSQFADDPEVKKALAPLMANPRQTVQNVNPADVANLSSALSRAKQRADAEEEARAEQEKDTTGAAVPPPGGLMGLGTTPGPTPPWNPPMLLPSGPTGLGVPGALPSAPTGAPATPATPPGSIRGPQDVLATMKDRLATMDNRLDALRQSYMEISNRPAYGKVSTGQKQTILAGLTERIKDLEKNRDTFQTTIMSEMKGQVVPRGSVIYQPFTGGFTEPPRPPGAPRDFEVRELPGGIGVAVAVPDEKSGIPAWREHYYSNTEQWQQDWLKKQGLPNTEGNRQRADKAYQSYKDQSMISRAEAIAGSIVKLNAGTASKVAAMNVTELGKLQRQVSLLDQIDGQVERMETAYKDLAPFDMGAKKFNQARQYAANTYGVGPSATKIQNAIANVEAMDSQYASIAQGVEGVTGNRLAMQLADRMRGFHIHPEETVAQNAQRMAAIRKVMGDLRKEINDHVQTVTRRQQAVLENVSKGMEPLSVFQGLAGGEEPTAPSTPGLRAPWGR